MWISALWLCGCPVSCRRSESGTGNPPPASSNRSAPASTDPTAADYPSPPLPLARVLLKDAYGGLHAVEVEVAANDAARTRGMMWRKSLEEGRGMLFIFSQERVQSFWMKNTLIPLDLLFINKDRKIVGIVSQAAPQTLSPRTVGKPSSYVLEVPGLWAERQGIIAGSEVELEGLSMIRVEG